MPKSKRESSPKGKSYLFFLRGIDIEESEKKYGVIIPSNITSGTPQKSTVTRIDDLQGDDKPPEVISFLDESKRSRKCSVSTVNPAIIRDKTCCFWDRHILPPGTYPIGCPIRFVFDQVIKTYQSETSKDKYTIRQSVLRSVADEISSDKESKLIVDKKGYYETDGVFCSFNCCAKFIEENIDDYMYKDSGFLLLRMYKEIHGVEIDFIEPAPHWRVLDDYGGEIPIDKFRGGFNRVSYDYHGTVKCMPIGFLFEEKLRF